MSWSRVHPIVGHAFYPGTWILDYLNNLCKIDFCKGPYRQRVMIRNVAKLSLMSLVSVNGVELRGAVIHS